MSDDNSVIKFLRSGKWMELLYTPEEEEKREIARNKEYQALNLKPCNECGSNYEHLSFNGKDIECETCRWKDYEPGSWTFPRPKYYQGTGETKESAAIRWNTRNEKHNPFIEDK